MERTGTTGPQDDLRCGSRTSCGRIRICSPGRPRVSSLSPLHVDPWVSFVLVHGFSPSFHRVPGACPHPSVRPRTSQSRELARAELSLGLVDSSGTSTSHLPSRHRPLLPFHRSFVCPFPFEDRRTPPPFLFARRGAFASPLVLPRFARKGGHTPDLRPTVPGACCCVSPAAADHEQRSARCRTTRTTATVRSTAIRRRKERQDGTDVSQERDTGGTGRTCEREERRLHGRGFGKEMFVVHRRTRGSCGRRIECRMGRERTSWS